MRETLPINIGEKYNLLTVISEPYIIKRRRHVNVKCDCGTIKPVKISHLKHGTTKSCGCYIKALTISRNSIHGLSRHPLHKVWSSMIQRCYSHHDHAFKNYGGRGIAICDEWRSEFKIFYDWAICNGWSKGLEIDRKNNDGNYEPSNCRWVTAKVNSNNKRSNRLIEFMGVIKTAKQWAEEYKIPYTCFMNRIDIYNWSIEKALTQKLKWSRT